MSKYSADLSRGCLLIHSPEALHHCEDQTPCCASNGIQDLNRTSAHQQLRYTALFTLLYPHYSFHTAQSTPALHFSIHRCITLLYPYCSIHSCVTLLNPQLYHTTLPTLLYPHYSIRKLRYTTQSTAAHRKPPKLQQFNSPGCSALEAAQTESRCNCKTI